MREIVLAMEFGLDPAPLCNPNISSEAMENIRIHLFKNQGVYENAKFDIHLKRTRIITVIIFAFTKPTTITVVALED